MSIMIDLWFICSCASYMFCMVMLTKFLWTPTLYPLLHAFLPNGVPLVMHLVNFTTHC